jgi:uncharacterized protein (TIGR03067 family)
MRSNVTRLTIQFGAALLFAMPGWIHADEAAANKELDKLQGTWRSVRVEQSGQDRSSQHNADLFIFEGTEVIAKTGDKETYRADISLEHGNPGKVTIKIKSGVNKGKVWVGIYEIDGDSFKWCGCWNFLIDTLPEAFRTESGNQYLLREMEKQKN